MEMLSFDCVHDALQAMTEQLAAAVRQKRTARSTSPSRAAGRQTAIPALGAGIRTENRVVTAALLLGRRTMRPAGRPGKQFQICRRTAVSKDRHPRQPPVPDTGRRGSRTRSPALRGGRPGRTAATRRTAALRCGRPRHRRRRPHRFDLPAHARITDRPGLLRGIAASGHRSVADHDDRPADPQRGGTAVSGHRPRKGGDPAKIDGPQGAEYPAGYILRRAERAAVYTNCKI